MVVRVIIMGDAALAEVNLLEEEISHLVEALADKVALKEEGVDRDLEVEMLLALEQSPPEEWGPLEIAVVKRASLEMEAGEEEDHGKHDTERKYS